MDNIKIVSEDKYLEPFNSKILDRLNLYKQKLNSFSKNNSLSDFADGYLFFGCHKTKDNWVFREWAPNATNIYLIGEHSNWQKNNNYKFEKKDNYWELKVPIDKLNHLNLYRLLITWDNGEGERIPAYVKRVVQDISSKIYSAQIWDPPKKYNWKYNKPSITNYKPLIYEAHIGMSHELGKVSTYTEFKDNVLPHIVKSGYNTIQLMAIQEHPYYGSFGYQVSSFYAPSSRFGTPEELKELIDEAHKNNIKVIMDLVHSHAVSNEVEGLAKYDGTEYQFFHKGEKGNHPSWGTKCFNYGKDEVLHFLLSNCKYWLEEFKFDGFRYDGVTSMLYHNHGLNSNFTSYNQYFDDNSDIDSQIYLMLSNKLVHQLDKNNITIAEEMSGMPGLAEPIENGGFGFDYRLAMGVPDYWIKLIKEQKDENWDVSNIYYELTNRRANEGSISYCESHDQALVGDQTIIFRLIGKEMYYSMEVGSNNYIVDRGIALHKLIRLITIATAGDGYLNFMGNEYGHPEWIDFPREGNNWSYHYCRRQWSLLKNTSLRYYMLNNFDKVMIETIVEHNCFEQRFPYKTFENIKDQTIAFKRTNLLFIFNFSPNNSYSDYKITVDPGEYKLLFSSDEIRFDGFDRVALNNHYFSQTNDNYTYISIYLPTRCALVLQKLF